MATINELSKKILWRYIAKAGKDIHGNTAKYAKRVKGVNKAGLKVQHYGEDVATNATGPNVAGTNGDVSWKKINKKMSKRLMDFYKG